MTVYLKLRLKMHNVFSIHGAPHPILSEIKYMSISDIPHVFFTRTLTPIQISTVRLSKVHCSEILFIPKIPILNLSGKYFQTLISVRRLRIKLHGFKPQQDIRIKYDI